MSEDRPKIREPHKMINVYVAGKVSKESSFGTHYWRDAFVDELARQSGRELHNLDPTKNEVDEGDALQVFGCDAYMISRSDVLIVYLSDDISVGGSQEILIAKYFGLPVIALAPHGGKFNGREKIMFGKVIKDYKDPFVFTTCDVVCDDIAAVSKTLQTLEDIKPKTLDIIPQGIADYLEHHAHKSRYITETLSGTPESVAMPTKKTP
jgi:hypothetical protein